MRYLKNIKIKFNILKEKKGGKFHNLFYMYSTKQEEMIKYDRFFVLDDDVIFETENGINKLFQISKDYELDICSPSYNGEGKISFALQPKIQIVF